MVSFSQESILNKYSPPLDSSLVLALLSDIEDVDKASQEQIDTICATLSELAAEAELLSAEQSLLTDITTTEDDTLDTTTDTNSTPPTSNDSGSSDSSSPLAFLRAVLPHIPTPRLKKAINDAEDESEDIDMWDVVAGILTEEALREMEERGLDGLDDDKSSIDDDDWETVRRKKSQQNGSRPKIKKNTTTFSLADIRQQHQSQYSSPRTLSPTSPSFSSSSSPDPWTQIQSITSYLATLLPPHPSTFFQPYFHSPTYVTPYKALYAALEAIVKAKSPSHSPNAEPLYDPVVLISMLDVILPHPNSSSSAPTIHLNSRLVSDVELALTATEGRSDDALDLVQLMQSLAEDHELGHLEMGVYHSSPTVGKSGAWGSSTNSVTNSTKRLNTTASSSSPLPDGPPPVPPPPQRLNSANRNGIPSKNKPSPYQWQAVASRKGPKKQQTYPLPQHVPTYERDVNGMKPRSRNRIGFGAGFGFGKDNDFSGAHKEKIAESLRKRNEMLREASRMWQRGNKKTRGGEIALYFAERAREFQELAKKESLDAARYMVESKRLATGADRNILDLHGTTVAEAIQIVKETLQSMRCTSSNPLKIITGKGTHSAGQVSVLKPAVRKALVEEGWVVTGWDGGLAVKGKRG